MKKKSSRLCLIFSPPSSYSKPLYYLFRTSVLFCLYHTSLTCGVLPTSLCVRVHMLLVRQHPHRCFLLVTYTQHWTVTPPQRATVLSIHLCVAPSLTSSGTSAPPLNSLLLSGIVLSTSLFFSHHIVVFL